MMLMNLFSVFDPTSYLSIPLGWLILFLMMFMILLNYYIIKVGILNMLFNLIMELMKMFMEIAKPNYLSIVFVVVSFFIYLAMSNLVGLFPFIFTLTAYPSITLGLGLVMWLSFVIMGWVMNFKHSSGHLVPEGSPLLLSPFMVLIEFVSHLIRPFTLAIRLAANMMAGHLIIGLLSSISLTNLFGLMSSVFFQSFLLILELCVAVIQGFVFSVLLLLYMLEYY